MICCNLHVNKHRFCSRRRSLFCTRVSLTTNTCSVIQHMHITCLLCLCNNIQKPSHTKQSKPMILLQPAHTRKNSPLFGSGRGSVFCMFMCFQKLSTFSAIQHMRITELMNLCINIEKQSHTTQKIQGVVAACAYSEKDSAFLVQGDGLCCVRARL